jgi:hypothetical protein
VQLPPATVLKELAHAVVHKPAQEVEMTVDEPFVDLTRSEARPPYAANCGG